MLWSAIGHFVFRFLVYLCYSVELCLVLYIMFIELYRELQVVALMMHRMAFHLSHKLVVLHLDNSTAGAYLCNEGDMKMLYILYSFQTSLLLRIWLTNQTAITIYIPTHLPLEANYLLQARLVLEWYLFSACSLSNLSILGSTRGGLVSILMYQSMPAVLYIGNLMTSWILWVKYFQPSLAVSGQFCVSCSCISPNTFVLISRRICNKLMQTSDFHCSLLDLGFWFPTVSCILENIPHQSPRVKDFIIDVLIDWMLRSLPWQHLWRYKFKVYGIEWLLDVL